MFLIVFLLSIFSPICFHYDPLFLLCYPIDSYFVHIFYFFIIMFVYVLVFLIFIVILLMLFFDFILFA